MAKAFPRRRDFSCSDAASIISQIVSLWRGPPAGVDHAVNAGVAASVRILQAAVEVMVDGAMGPRTLFAVCQANPNDLVLRLSRAQTEFYDAGAAEPMFRQGLIRRVASRTNAALVLLG